LENSDDASSCPHPFPPPSKGEDEGGGRGFRGNIPLNILVVAG